ncbi:hypothetical protein IV460_00775 [Enterococcus casseliflavus]|uniref:hypothetical protein n=1 Tax=Enterococcus casseliflavus TaxID=37734 RepID=UPI001E2A1BFE|nr:hypothetical protein [Enterococcus casseliflavus]MCD5189590.1 hypothetical protein [Enterococcus casseliflavus]MDT2960401.1 hypothetical protein [Enterococcus casseliflavus]
MDSVEINFKNYLIKKDTLTFEEMENLHVSILESANSIDEEFLEIWQDLIESAIDYTKIRAEWNFYSKDKKMEVDSMRTNKHDNVIITFLMLERFMIQKKWSIEWTKQLFLQDIISNRTKKDVVESRKRIGDFANYLAFIYALNGR